MVGRHKFPSVPAGHVVWCEHCGKTEEYLDAHRIEGKLPACPDAADDLPQHGTRL
jgi:hypothetical protein